MIGKYVYFLAVFVSIVVVTKAQPLAVSTESKTTNQYHHLVYGAHYGDRLVLMQDVIKASVSNQIVTIQQTFFASNEIITLVKAIDQKADGTGAVATVVSGGPGNNNVTLQFESLRGYGINFVVELYAKP